MTETPMLRTGIVYCRVSSEDQVEGTSLQSQERICRDYAAREGIRVLAVFVERGESAKTADRTELTRAVKFCTRQCGAVDCFVVYKLDRFSRNHEDHVTVKAVLRRAGTELVSATEPIDHSPVGRLMETMLAGIAEFDNNVRTERTKQGMVERVHQGVWVWKEPIGYMRTGRGENITPDPEVAPLVRYAFEEYSKGTHTYSSLATHLADQGLRTPKGNRPGMQLVAKILHNPIYHGVISVWGKEFAGTFPPIVSRDLFGKCQIHPDPVLKRVGSRSVVDSSFPLRGLLACSVCGSVLTGSRTTGRWGARYPYYHHRRQGCPSARFIRVEEVDRQLMKLLHSFRLKPKYASALRVALSEVYQELKGDERTRRLRVESAIQGLLSEREKVFRLHRRGVYSDEDFSEQKRLIDLALNEKRRLLMETDEDDFDGLWKEAEKILSEMANPSAVWQDGELEQRVRLLSTLVRGKIPVFERTVGTPELTCIYSMNQCFDGQISALVAQCRAQWHQLLAELHHPRQT